MSHIPYAKVYERIERIPSRGISEKLKVNDVIKVRINRKTSLESYPWGGGFAPLMIDAIYPKFIVCTVMPHRNPTVSFGTSKPYTVTLDKFEIDYGYVDVRKA